MSRHMTSLLLKLQLEENIPSMRFHQDEIQQLQPLERISHWKKILIACLLWTGAWLKKSGNINGLKNTETDFGEYIIEY